MVRKDVWFWHPLALKLEPCESERSKFLLRTFFRSERRDKHIMSQYSRLFYDALHVTASKAAVVLHLTHKALNPSSFVDAFNTVVKNKYWEKMENNYKKKNVLLF